MLKKKRRKEGGRSHKKSGEENNTSDCTAGKGPGERWNENSLTRKSSFTRGREGEEHPLGFAKTKDAR